MSHFIIFLLLKVPLRLTVSGIGTPLVWCIYSTVQYITLHLYCRYGTERNGKGREGKGRKGKGCGVKWSGAVLGFIGVGVGVVGVGWVGNENEMFPRASRGEGRKFTLI